MKIRKNQQEYTTLQWLAYLAQRITCGEENPQCKDCPMHTVHEICRKYALSHPEDTLSRLGWEIVEEDEPESLDALDRLTRNLPERLWIE